MEGKIIEHATFRPYGTLVPNKDGCAKEYPLRFVCANIQDGCIWYTVATGSCKAGLPFLDVG
jgi:hypothetical protein